MLATSTHTTEPALLDAIVSRGSVTRRDSRSAVVTTQALDWPGVLVEAGRNDVAAVDDLVGDQHYLSLNLDTAPLTLEVKSAKLPKRSWIKMSQVRTLSVDRLTKRIGVLGLEELDQVIEGLNEIIGN